MLKAKWQEVGLSVAVVAYWGRHSAHPHQVHLAMSCYSLAGQWDLNVPRPVEVIKEQLMKKYFGEEKQSRQHTTGLDVDVLLRAKGLCSGTLRASDNKWWMGAVIEGRSMNHHLGYLSERRRSSILVVIL